MKSVDNILEETRHIDYAFLSDDREALARQALKNCSEELYYDLADCIDSLSNEDLLAIISFEGMREKEQDWIEKKIERS